MEESSEECEKQHNFRKDEQKHTHTKAFLNFFSVVPLTRLNNNGAESDHGRDEKPEEARVDHFC